MLTIGYEAIADGTAKPLSGKPKARKGNDWGWKPYTTEKRSFRASPCKVFRPDAEGDLRLVKTIASPSKRISGSLFQRDYSDLMGPSSLAKGEARKKRWGTL
jgi:hypothetical protein